MDNANNKKSVLLLTACVNPNGMGMTALQDIDARRKQYLETIEWYLNNTKASIVFVENSGNDLSFAFTDYINKGRLECLTFTGNDYDKSKGKGVGEAEIIQYGLNNSTLLKDSASIIKITGRLKCNRINTIIKKCHKLDTVYSSYTKDGCGNVISNSQVFVFVKRFWDDYFYPYVDNINDCKGTYFEHVLYNAIKQWKRDGNKFDNFWFPLDIEGVSGSTGKTITSNSSFFIETIHYVLHLCGYNGSLRFWKKK